MKLIRYGNPSSKKLAVLEGDTRIDVSELVGDYDETFFANIGLAELARLARTKSKVGKNKSPHNCASAVRWRDQARLCTLA
jgi:hypothetical protein